MAKKSFFNASKPQTVRGSSAAALAAQEIDSLETISAREAAQPYATGEEHMASSLSGKEVTEVITKQKTVISPNTVIVGNIKSESDVSLYGTIKGNIETTENLQLSGSVEGEVFANSIKISGCKMHGDVDAKVTVSVDSNSVILGNINAQNLMINGTIRGNLSIQQGIVLRDSAIVLGNVTARSIAVSDGAKIKGEVKMIFDNDIDLNKLAAFND